KLVGRPLDGKCTGADGGPLNFLVIGGRTESDWRATDAGNHVDLVNGFRKTGSVVQIIGEDCWSRSLPVASLLWSG
ncbi:MAG: hypothetical protein AAGF72_17335, partial [Pseudomonadota bacterium]